MRDGEAREREARQRVRVRDIGRRRMPIKGVVFNAMGKYHSFAPAKPPVRLGSRLVVMGPAMRGNRDTDQTMTVSIIAANIVIVIVVIVVVVVVIIVIVIVIVIVIIVVDTDPQVIGRA